MADWVVTKVKGHLEKLYSELDEINAEEKIKIEEVAKIRALHTTKLKEARVLSARLHQLQEQQIALLQREIHAIRSMPGYAENDTTVRNDQPVESIIEEDRCGAVAVCGADDDDEDDDDEDNEDNEDAEDEDDEHGDEDGGAAAEDDSETGHGGRWSSGSDDDGGEYPAYDDDIGTVDSDAYRRPNPTSFYDPWD
ncbi:nonsense-mediated mRNA decay protein 2-like [Chenopodium quinoa]|uniref:nonsense-mediated mRNA decay protein 2-like n=1 Tax=Chenopodium quinoa TaxID=63459 RepID=UPI000B786B28|nr:nonsense-mediated mRNA decay protein 2-like [Chenopodium quinoa]